MSGTTVRNIKQEDFEDDTITIDNSQMFLEIESVEGHPQSLAHSDDNDTFSLPGGREDVRADVTQLVEMDSCQDIFSEIEATLKVSIPEYLKNILMIGGYDSKVIVANLSQENIVELEQFARNDLHQLVDEDDLPKYYGLFAKVPSTFRFLSGHRLTLTLLANYCKEITLSNEREQEMPPYWDQDSLFILGRLKTYVKDKSSTFQWDVLKKQMDEIRIAVKHQPKKKKSCTIICICHEVFKLTYTGRWYFHTMELHLKRRHVDAIQKNVRMLQS